MNTNRKTLLLFWRENMKYPGLFLMCCTVWTVGMILQRLALGLIAAQALNKLVAVYNQPDITYWHTFWPYLVSFVAVGLISQALIDYGLVLLSKLETKVRPQLQNRAFTWIMSQSLAFHANTFSGAIVNQVNKFTTAYIQLTDTFTIVLLKMFATVALAIVIITFFSWPIALFMTVWTCAFVYLNIVLVKRRLPYARATAAADTVLTAHLADSMGNVAAVKSFGNEDDEAANHSDKAYDRTHKKYRSWVAAIQNDVILAFMMTILQIATLSLSIYAVLHHSIAIGTMLLIQVYISQIIGELWNLSNVSRTVEQALTDAEEMTETFDISPEITDPATPLKAHITKGAISFDHVTFAHDGAHEPLFSDFSLAIKPGEKIGLVGHSGSGKTTLTRLLLRFSDVNSGAITIDGQNIARLKQADLRKHIAYVPQEPLLFHRSLRENIAYADTSVSQERVEQAAKQAHANDFIQLLPDRYNTLVGERGVKLSGGQRQRIAIARAMIKDAPILVLDEATSALDSESEKLIQEALGKLMQHRTTIVIAHRLSTIQKMDRIVVMDNGAIVEQGTHQQLIKQKGAYAKLWHHQSGGFIEE
jgi:ATP-binding cassette, subfamily B, bacterial